MLLQYETAWMLQNPRCQGARAAARPSSQGAWKSMPGFKIPFGAAKSRSEGLFFGSKSFQERLNKHSRGLPGTFSVDAAIRITCWSRFNSKKDALGPKNSRNFVRRPQNFVALAISAEVASGTRFGTLPGEHFGFQDG